jgi:hypothetical protein
VTWPAPAGEAELLAPLREVVAGVLRPGSRRQVAVLDLRVIAGLGVVADALALRVLHLGPDLQAEQGVELAGAHCADLGLADRASPHLAVLQVVRQRSVSTMLPSSHSSTPAWTLASPHLAVLQVVRQASVSTMLPSSQSSPICLMVSPHLGALHMLVQASSLTMLPSSQSSPICLMVSPHLGALHMLLQASSSTMLPSSHSSTSA